MAKKWKDQATQLGIGTVVAGLKAVERGVSKKKYKRLLATAPPRWLRQVARRSRWQGSWDER
jgi:hypothetical protein